VTSEPRIALRSAGIVGLGLIGGSIARDLHALRVRVLGYDRDRATLDMSCAEGAVDQALDASLAGLEDVDAVIVAVPVSSLPDTLRTIARSTSARLITDVGSTKRSAIAAAESHGVGERFVGSHPMAGDHHCGWGASRRGLFAGATVYLCRTRHTGEQPVALARELWRVLGARPQIIDADKHDQLLAYASHLMQSVGTALALTLQDAGVSRTDLGPGGRDSTRLAGGSIEMWTAIARDNADALGPAIHALEMRLEQLRTALAQKDETAVRAIFSAARAWSMRGAADADEERP
jgi:prephenate dehydrogenase